MKTILTAAAAVVALAAPAFAQEGDVAQGEKDWRKCKACHSIIDPDGEVLQKGGKTGPNLYGVIGRQAGTVEDFGKYTDEIVALGEEGLMWDAEELAKYVVNAKEYIGARTSMTPQKLGDPLDVIAFLAQYGPGGAFAFAVLGSAERLGIFEQRLERCLVDVDLRGQAGEDVDIAGIAARQADQGGKGESHGVGPLVRRQIGLHLVGEAGDPARFDQPDVFHRSGVDPVGREVVGETQFRHRGGERIELGHRVFAGNRHAHDCGRQREHLDVPRRHGLVARCQKLVNETHAEPLRCVPSPQLQGEIGRDCDRPREFARPHATRGGPNRGRAATTGAPAARRLPLPSAGATFHGGRRRR